MDGSLHYIVEKVGIDGDIQSWQSQSYGGMEKIVELESDFGDLVGCVSDLKDFQLAESTRLKLTSQAELRQLKEKVRRLEEAGPTGRIDLREDFIANVVYEGLLVRRSLLGDGIEEAEETEGEYLSGGEIGSF
ncbi:hypothetical protein ACLOJK_018305 [Asimina triloba]